MNDILGLLYVTLGGLLDGYSCPDMARVVVDYCGPLIDGATVTGGVELWEDLWDIHNCL